MRTLLLSVVESDQDGKGPYLPLSAMAVATTLRRSGFDVQLIDVQVDHDWRSRLADECGHAGVLAISALTGFSLRNAFEAVSIARSVNPEIAVVWGGYHALTNYPALLRQGYADHVVIGSNERSVRLLWESLSAGDTEPDIPATARLHAGQLVVGASTRLDRVPDIAYADFDTGAYLRENGGTLHAITSYGCPHACTFCLEPTNTGRKWIALDAGSTVAFLKGLHRDYLPRLISLHDPNFSTDPRRVVEIATQFTGEGVRIPLLCNMRATDVVAINKRMPLSRLRDAGFESIFIGVESGSDRVLGDMAKRATSEDALLACSLLDRAGIVQLTSFIHDYPGETEADQGATFAMAERLAQLPTNRQRHHFYTPFPTRADADDHQPAQEWVDTSTYYSSRRYPGNGAHRDRVVSRLEALRDAYPHAIEADGIPRNFSIERAEQA